MCPSGWVGGGWLDTDNKAILVQLNLTGTESGTELGKKEKLASVHIFHQIWPNYRVNL